MRQFETNVRIRDKILVIVILILLITIGMSSALYWGITSSQEREHWVAHTHRVISEIDALLLQLVNMETGARGFAITGDETFLEPYNAGWETYQQHYTTLYEMVSDNPEQQNQLNPINEDVQEWKTNVLEHIITLRRQVNDGEAELREVDAFITSGEGKKRLDTIRAQIDTFRAFEVALLDERSLESQNAAILLQRVLFGGIGLAVVLGMTVAVVIAGRISRRINDVATAASSMAAGNLDIAHTVPEGRDEVGVLADAFTSMANTIRSQIEEQHRINAERAELQQQVIESQKNTLRELSTPLIPISDTVLIMPLIGAIDSQRAEQIMETLLEGVMRQKAKLVILDITGVQVVDTQVANALIRTAQAVRLLGAQVMLTGIRSQIAQTLVQLGVDLSDIITKSSLQDGIMAAFYEMEYQS